MEKKKIILASSSPRRIEFFKKLFGDEFEINPSRYDEDNTLALPPEELALLHSRKKAEEVASRVKEGVILGVDTFVFLDGEVLGKPKDEEDARDMLRKQSGRWVDIISGMTLVDLYEKKTYQEPIRTKLRMAKLSENEIKEYVATGEPMGKAGAFAIQEKGGVFIDSIEGCYSNVIGLSLKTLNSMLKKAGIDIFNYG